MPKDVMPVTSATRATSADVILPHDGAHDKKVPNHHKIFTSSLAGGTAGAVAKTVIAPFDRVKINFQVSNRRFCTQTALKFIVDSVRTDGITSLWRGNTATMVRIVPYAAIQYASHEQYKILLNRKHEKHLPPVERFLAGSLAGITSTTITYPLDLVRARMAVTRKQYYHSISEVVIKTWKREGFSTLYRGYTPTALGVMPYAGTSFFTYETLKKFHHDNFEGKITPLHKMCYGAIAGACGQSFTYPLDIVRRRMQTEGVLCGPEKRFKTILGTMRYIIREEGFIRGMYKGLSLNWIKGPIAVGTSFMTFETVQQFLRRFTIFHS